MFLMFLILHSRSTLGILKVFFSSFLQALLQLSFYYQCPCYCKGYVCQQSKSFLCMTIYIQGLARNTLGLRLLYINFCCVRFRTPSSFVIWIDSILRTSVFFPSCQRESSWRHSEVSNTNPRVYCDSIRISSQDFSNVLLGLFCGRHLAKLIYVWLCLTVPELDFHHGVLTNGSHLLSFQPMNTKIGMDEGLPIGNHLVPRKLTSASTWPHWRPFSWKIRP